MALKQEDLFVNVRVPNENIVVETCRENQMVFSVPIQTIDALLMTEQRLFRLKTVHAPQTDFFIESSRCKQVKFWYRQQIHDLFSFFVVELLVRSSRIVSLAHSYFFELLNIIHVNYAVHTSCEESIDVVAAPFNYKVGQITYCKAEYHLCSCDLGICSLRNPKS